MCHICFVFESCVILGAWLINYRHGTDQLVEIDVVAEMIAKLIDLNSKTHGNTSYCLRGCWVFSSDYLPSQNNHRDTLSTHLVPPTINLVSYTCT